MRVNTSICRAVAAVSWKALAFLLFALPATAQFSGSINGVVQDPSGAAIPNASLTLTNLATSVQSLTKTDATGFYKFASLGPGQYTVVASAPGFTKASASATLETSQDLNVSIRMQLGASSETVLVTAEAPLVDTTDNRTQLTLGTQALSALPLAGRSMISLVTFAPGATGLGLLATSGGGNSTGSGVDNYSTETQVNASANGMGSVGNLYVVDGLDVTSDIRPGVLNLTPNPDAIQETSIQTNTYSVEFGRSSSLEMAMTTKSGTEAFHGNASDYFSSQQLWTRTEFTPQTGYAPFHSNNMSATVGGPIIPHHQAFFFFSIEPLRSSASTGTSVVSFEAPAFTAWAQQNFPSTLGTKVLTSFPASGASSVATSQTAAQVFPTTCGTSAADNIPCALPVFATGVFNSTSFRNGNQYSIRGDKYFTNDRVYGSLFRTTLQTGGPAVRPAFAAGSDYYEYAMQFNETHTFSARTLNQAIFQTDRVQGRSPVSGDFSVPVINVTGLGTGFGSGFAAGNFIQRNYHWRDVLTHVQKSHTLSAGYEGWWGNDDAFFNGPYDQPNFQFNSMLDLVNDNPFTESSVTYNPATGIHNEFVKDPSESTFGAYVSDTWKVGRNLTVNYGLRYDDMGNVHELSGQMFGNFHLGYGQTIEEQIANGSIVSSHYALDRSMTSILSPRGGFSWDPTGKGVWVVRGGVGIYHNWPTLGNLEEGIAENPPAYIVPTFYAGGTPAPLFVLGDSNTPPFGFQYPVLGKNLLNAQGGVTGLQLTIGADDPNLRPPTAYVYSAGIERGLGKMLTATVEYTGSQARSLINDSGCAACTYYGQDINSYPGDLIQHNSLTPSRLNQSFGQIQQQSNTSKSGYNAFIASLRGRFLNRGFVNASYTYSASKDDVETYPSWINISQYYGPSSWDVPNRFSLTWSYELPGANGDKGLIGRVTNGWSLTADTILQSGTPFTVSTNAAFNPILSSSGQFIGIATTSGDYNADGDDYDFPSVSSYSLSKSRSAFLKGQFAGGQSGQFANGYANFPLPQFGQEGNEKFNGFRGPGFASSDLNFAKNTKIAETVAFQLRFEFFDVFNRPNLAGVDSNLPDSTFGKATSQYTPRWMQIGGNLTF